MAVVIEDGTKLILSSNLVMNFFLAASLQQLWQMINTQQIIILLPLFRITLPSNIAIVFNLLMKIAAFDVIRTDGLYDQILDLPHTEPLTPNFEAVGFESLLLLYNLGSISLIALALLLTMIGVHVLTYVPTRFHRIHNFANKLEKALYWNSFIRIMTESFMVVLICCMINTSHLSWLSVSEAINSTLVILIFGFVIGFTCWLLYTINRYFYQLENVTFKSRYGTAYEGLNFKQGKLLLAHIFMFYLRRALLGWCAVYIRYNLAIQIALLFSTTLL